MKVSIRDRAIILAVARYCRGTFETYQVGASIESVYYPGGAVNATHYAFAAETGATRSRLQRALLTDPDASARESRDLACVIIDHDTSFSFSSLNRLDDLQPLSDRLI
jgi:hypothetical protein